MQIMKCQMSNDELQTKQVPQGQNACKRFCFNNPFVIYRSTFDQIYTK